MAEQDKEISVRESELETLTVRIEDTEKFVEEVSEAAYESAVKSVTDRVIEETHNADFDEIEKLKNSLTSDKSRNSPQMKSIVRQTLDLLMKRFEGMTARISERLAVILKDPVQKRKMQEPIRKSVHERMAQFRREADAYNAQRGISKEEKLKKKKENMEL